MAKRTRDADSRVPLAIVAMALAVTAVHSLTPAGPHAWHPLHLVAQKLYFVPILLAAASYGLCGSLVTAAAVGALFLVHVLRDWSAHPMVQADQAAESFNFALAAVVASVLFERERGALEETRRAHEETLRALASSLELRERSTAGHCERVRSYTLLIASELGVEASLHSTLAAGALLHDIGKIGVADAILLKQGALDGSESIEMRRHPELGAALIGDVRFLAAARELVLAHHERFDGTGYPRRLSGEAIPLGARIFAVADTFDAMTTERTYHRQSSFEDASHVIREGRGTQFDPVVADAFLAIPFEAIADAASRHGVQLRRG